MVFNDGHCERCGELMTLTSDVFPISSWSCGNRICAEYNKTYYRPHNMLQLFAEFNEAKLAYENISLHQARFI